VLASSSFTCQNPDEASRMNKAVVVFMKRVNLVGRLIASGICVGANFSPFESFD
jgi:hypothetical protein